MTTRIDALYLIVALGYFVVGIGLGIGMGIAQDFRLMHLHAHINLVGFVGHGVFGLTHRLWPGLRDSSLATVQLWTMLISTPIFLAGLPLAQYCNQPILAIIGSLVVFSSALLFFIMFAGKALREARAYRALFGGVADSGRRFGLRRSFAAGQRIDMAASARRGRRHDPHGFHPLSHRSVPEGCLRGLRPPLA